tara:strand:- start:36 stop:464 length:429 start_codon:yes stop_codon:yes gene_type:complete
VNFRLAVNNDINHIIKINSHTVKWPNSMIYKEFKLNLSKSFVLENNNQVVGYVMLRKADSEIDIINFAIDVDFHRMGYGSLLMNEILKTFNKSHKIFIEVSINNLAARNLYNKFEFKDISIRKNYYNYNEDAVVMIRENGIA